jgi:RNA recognition motif-containing protein
MPSAHFTNLRLRDRDEKKIGFLNFPSEEAALAFIKKNNNTKVHGKKIKVKLAK